MSGLYERLNNIEQAQKDLSKAQLAQDLKQPTLPSQMEVSEQINQMDDSEVLMNKITSLEGMIRDQKRD